MSKINNNKIAASLIEQLSLQETSLSIHLTNIIATHQIVSYDSLKELSRKIKEYLKDNGEIITHSQVLNYLSKALGYQNHHSLKHDSASSIPGTININEDSNLTKFFKCKDELFTKFNFPKWEVSYDTFNAHNFSFFYEAYTLEYKTKVELNKYLRSHGIKPYKNTIPLVKIKYDKIQDIAYLLITHFKNFFTPMWYEPTIDNPKSSINRWPTLSYSNIHQVKGLIYVDDYSTDLFSHCINKFIDYIICNGTIKDIEIFNSIIKGTYQKEEVFNLNKKFSPVDEWESKLFYKKVKKHYFKGVKMGECLNKVDNFNLFVEVFMHPILKKIEEHNNLTIKELLIETCEYFEESDLTDYKIHSKISNYLTQRLYDKSFDELVNEVNENDDINMDKVHMQLTIMQLLHHTYNIIKVYVQLKE